MTRRPLWPIAVGLTVWGAAIYVAVTGPWWPLAVVAAISLIPGLLIGFIALLGRGARRDAQALLEQTAGPDRARPRDPEPVAEPPAAQPSKSRTNAKTAGRRRGGKAGAVLVLLAASELHGCEKIERARAERRAKETAEDGGAPVDGPTSDATANEGTAAASPTTPTAPIAAHDAALDAALARAITPPSGLEATWRVDPFVAALLAEQIRAGLGPSFTRLDAPVPDGPRVGFRVGTIADGSMLHRLGLRTGDVIETIGGVELSDASRIGFALDGAENKLDVMVFRDGLSTVHSYRLTQGLAWRALLADFPPGTAAVGGTTPTEVAAAGGDPASGGAGGTAVVPTPRPSGSGAAGGAGAGGSGAGGSGAGGSGSGGSGGGASGGGGGSAGGGSGGSSGGGSTPSASDPVRCESSSKCTVTKAYFDKMVASPSSLQAQANIVPAIANDVHSGYKLKSVKAGSAIAKLGFRAGDKITHVNGVDLTDELSAIGLLGDLSSKSLFRIRYERGGSASTKTVVVD